MHFFLYIDVFSLIRNLLLRYDRLGCAFLFKFNCVLSIQRLCRKYTELFGKKSVS